MLQDRGDPGSITFTKVVACWPDPNAYSAMHSSTSSSAVREMCNCPSRYR